MGAVTAPEKLCSVLEYRMMDTVQKVSNTVIHHHQNPLQLNNVIAFIPVAKHQLCPEFLKVSIISLTLSVPTVSLLTTGLSFNQDRWLVY
jgi:hypothetical protein